jgi:hypothetical protein
VQLNGDPLGRCPQLKEQVTVRDATAIVEFETRPPAHRFSVRWVTLAT